MPLFRRAEQEGLWFYSPYQQLWFSPEALRRQQERGSFRWGAVNWELRDPRERIAELRRQGKAAYDAAEAIEAELRIVTDARYTRKR